MRAVLRESTGEQTVTRGPSPGTPAVAAPPRRLVSLDVFRGITIAGMLLVNNPGSWAYVYGPLQHAEWHGWTPTDLIFPFFLFIVGVATTFSFGNRLDRGADRRELFAKVAKRSLILFGLGLLLHGFPEYDLSTIRIPGVLQRIAVAYFFASAVVLTTGWRGQAAVAGTLLLVYWGLLMLVPVPGVGAGVLEPGRDLGAFLDRLVFGTEHLWAQSRTWDPEGILSTLPAIGTVLVGVLAGHWIRSDRRDADKLVGLFIAANTGLGLGLLWGTIFPINKSLWTSSYVLFTGGMALHLLAICYWLVDVRHRRAWAKPFVILGMNAIAAFFLSGLFARVLGLVQVGGDPGDVAAVSLKAWLYNNLFASWAGPLNGSLTFAVGYVLVWLGLMAVLYRRRIFIKV